MPLRSHGSRTLGHCRAAVKRFGSLARASRRVAPTEPISPAAAQGVRCDFDDPDYLPLWRAAIGLVTCVSVLPFVYLALLYNCRTAIRKHVPTRLSRACRFLWAEYKDEYWFFEVVQQARSRNRRFP